ncbi:MAG: GyrI-like domain-containing protein, partial [Candidatus Bathyarchaeota archaeon]|nr:GyrI-like domain-containing protein [Candidatus Bathyarchaeota archaeon]
MKIDFRKELKHLYNPPRTRVEIVDVPQMNFLMIDGSGDPNTAQEYTDSVEALYAVSYTLKFMVKKAKGVDYGVLPLEGLWWTGDDDTFSLENKDLWNWTSLMMQPEHVSKASAHKALEHVEKKKNPPALAKARFEPFREGLCAQT